MSAGAPRIREAGDSALLLELDAVIDGDVNARAIAIAQAVRDARILGVRDVISTYRSVAVFFDPLTTDPSLIVHAMRAAPTDAPAPVTTAIEIPVVYGGEHGPDLEAIAARAGVSNEEVIERHASATYRVYMLGFLPGFAYMGSVDPAIAAPRRAEPRFRVPAGSVGIAGRQTGIYPRESPGGWQLIGRTSAVVFDAARTPASLFAPGDHVRFVPVRGARGVNAPAAGGAQTTAAMRRADALPIVDAARQVTIVAPGLFTTVQDLGRWGHQALGVPVAGAMDALSHRLANLLVGNPADAAALEITVLGPELRLGSDTTVAIAGADLSPTLDNAPMPMHVARRCRAGSILRFGERRRGARAYIAFDGGIATTPVLGSRATHALSALGGLAGGPLKAGDRLPLQPAAAAFDARGEREAPPTTTGGARLRVLRGPQDDFFDSGAIETLQRTRFTITVQSDRMGYRLAGRARIERRAEREMISDVTLMGGIQVPPSGDPILLMADRQTTGGYPQIATVITADLAAAGQLAPGDWIEFQLCTRAEAIAALAPQEASVFAAP